MNSLFIELIQISLGNRKALSQIPSESDWKSLFELAQQQTIVGVLINALEVLPIEQRPHKRLLLQWVGLTRINEQLFYHHCKKAQELTDFFGEAGIRSCVLKGIGLAQLYPSPEKRQAGDIDLWVSGDRKTITSWLKTRCKVDHVIWHHAEAHIFKDVATEIHFHPCWLYNPFYNRRLQRWFEEEQDGQLVVDKELGFAYPSVRFNAVYTLVHTYHHLIEEGIGLRHLVDYYYVMRSLPIEEKAMVVDQLRYFGMLRLAEAIMWVLYKICGMPEEYMICAPNEREGKFLLDEIERGGNFGHYRSDNRKRNTAGRMLALLPHFPKEVLWVVPWKLWHKCWRVLYKNG